MGMFTALNSSASALTAQRLKMDVTSSNIANADSTHGTLVNGKWEPYRRKMVVTSPNENSFNSLFQSAKGVGGVKVIGIVEDKTPFKTVYQPDHPDADADGYVRLPNVDPLKEMVDLVSTTRSYEANVTALNAAKGIYLKSLEIGR
ncbi:MULTISPECIES: flagellar basal body rod protein FlgC [Fictibacillus]|uniref:Flagellar basal-body rod protein FlgC n=1 Tax=Fictibacillus enclensis TaxID=1017270 RepID=A0A0V8JDK3_9BACL|nr:MULTISPECIES: flagellar basal body rod protein FlgC [Fictibacillus]KSU85065.1 flagellar basal-body rod protein FlgC [Fictibacillus enclensis]RXY99277.1 flagellar basal body rod protein FlgC [Fictibacillus sp. S7]SCB90382.1 flagellar basal-body rod protein FlgC [Fictibacillus enclensis]